MNREAGKMNTQESKKQIRPYGLWPSPVSPQMLSRRIRIGEPQWDSDGKTLLWLEARAGQGTVVAQTTGDARRDLNLLQSAGGGLMFGGGTFSVRDGVLLFAARDGRLYRRSLGHSQPRAITPPFGRVAAPALSPDGRWVIYTFTDGHTDCLGLVDADGQGWPRKLARGADFYMQPVWHPQGTHLAWVEWDHPNMPWNGARLKLARFDSEGGRLFEERTIAGDENTSVMQPEFSPDGRWLSFIRGSAEWEDLVLIDLESGAEHVLVRGDGFMLSEPAWIQGRRFYGWMPASKGLYYIRSQQSMFTLWQAELSSGRSKQIDTGPYTFLDQLSVSPVRDEVCFIAAAPDIPNRIVRWDEYGLHTMAYSQPEMLSLEMMSTPQPIQWSAEDGTSVFGNYYPPANACYMGTGMPPAIINIHGGPTAQAYLGYDGERTYFTSRGYGWLDVNYRGSTSYGRRYQNMLDGRWGDLDVEDAADGAQALVDLELAEGSQLVIRGSSAGGYTVLNSLVRYPGQYRAGICLYGIGNLFTLAMETHKFELHYTDRMIGVLPEARDKYYGWSALFHAERIRDPLALFHGDKDRSVPPAQSEEIARLLQANGVPHLFQLYEGEGHGFRQEETIADYLRQTERFLQEQVLFAP
jgi:dipeptidyl aminopeptidase/acylaminoacyl peptidase